MKDSRKAARKRLKEATQAEYKSLILAANLIPIQRKILDLNICKGRSVSSIAMELFCCEATVRNHLASVYDKIAKS